MLNLTSQRTRWLIVAIAGPPLIMTSTCIAFELATDGEGGLLGDAVRLGFFILPLLSYPCFSRAMRLWDRPIWALVLAPVYLFVMFWITAGVTLYGLIFTFGIYD